MKQTIEDLQERFRELNNDLARIAKVSAESPHALEQLRPTLRALSEAIREVHSEIREAELNSSKS